MNLLFILAADSREINYKLIFRIFLCIQIFINKAGHTINPDDSHGSVTVGGDNIFREL